VPSARGELVEVVGGYAVTALARAEGETLESSGVTGTTAFEWGQTLARLHGAGSMSAMPLLPSSEALLRGDDLGSETAAAVADVSTKLLGLPRGPDVYGVLHGDPESDNVVATDDGLLFIDPDEVRLGWFVSDVVFALRDWADPAGGLAWTSGGIPAAFLAGYRSVRPLTGRELSWVPLLSRAAGLEELGVLRRLTAHPRSSDWPEWALTLDGRLRQRASSLQTMLTPSPSGRRR
jgi:Ser/Thr protein kinase RdoA (MazF antagonist)